MVGNGMHQYHHHHHLNHHHVQQWAPSPPQHSPMSGSGEEIRTIFISGLPEDVKERELQNLMRWLPGYEASQINFKGEVPMGFALFSQPHYAIAAKDTLQDLLFDSHSNSILHTEMANKNLFVKRGRSLFFFTDQIILLTYLFLFSFSKVVVVVVAGIVADPNDQSKRMRTGDSAYTTFHPPPPPPPVWPPHGYMAPPPPPYDPYGGYSVSQLPMPAPPPPLPIVTPLPAPSSYMPVQNTKDNPPCNTLFIGNIGENINEEELRGLFSM